MADANPHSQTDEHPDVTSLTKIRSRTIRGRRSRTEQSWLPSRHRLGHSWYCARWAQAARLACQCVPQSYSTRASVCEPFSSKVSRCLSRRRESLPPLAWPGPGGEYHMLDNQLINQLTIYQLIYIYIRSPAGSAHNGSPRDRLALKSRDGFLCFASVRTL